MIGSDRVDMSCVNNLPLMRDFPNHKNPSKEVISSTSIVLRQGILLDDPGQTHSRAIHVPTIGTAAPGPVMVPLHQLIKGCCRVSGLGTGWIDRRDQFSELLNALLGLGQGGIELGHIGFHLALLGQQSLLHQLIAQVVL